MARLNIGTAGWSIPRQCAHCFPSVGTSLQRYCACFHVVEVNSSFHRSHRPSTWERWHDSVPPSFRFSVKFPKEITHRRKLVGYSEALTAFLDQVSLLGEQLAVLLVQLPPKLAFEEPVAGEFLSELRARSPAQIACEPRHPSWFTPSAEALLEKLGISRVAADPAICPEAASPGGSKRLSYWRFHGSPTMYRSAYGDRLHAYADALVREVEEGRDVWCIFDNTASSAATGDALELTRIVACASG